MELGKLFLIICGLLIADSFTVSYVLCDSMIDDAEKTTSDAPMTLETFATDGITMTAHSNDGNVNSSGEDQTYTTRNMEHQKDLNNEHVSDLVTEGDNYANDSNTPIADAINSMDFLENQGRILTKPPKAEMEPLSTSLTAAYHVTEAQPEDDKKVNANATEHYPMEKLSSEKPMEKVDENITTRMDPTERYTVVTFNFTVEDDDPDKDYNDDYRIFMPKSGRVLKKDETFSGITANPDITTYGQSQFTPKSDGRTTFETHSTDVEGAKTPRGFEKKDATGLSNENNDEDKITEPTTFTESEVLSRSATATGRSLEFSRTGFELSGHSDEKKNVDNDTNDETVTKHDVLLDHTTTQNAEAVSRAIKRFGVKEENRYTNERRRPVLPAAGSSRPGIDLVRPHRPDTPLQDYPYYRPNPDSRVPIAKPNPDVTRPSKPSPDSQVPSNPNFSYGKPTADEYESSRPTYHNSRPSLDSYPQKPNNNNSWSASPGVINNHFGISRPSVHRTSSSPNPVQEEVYNHAPIPAARPSFKPVHGRPNYPQTGFGKPFRHPSNDRNPERTSPNTPSVKRPTKPGSTITTDSGYSRTRPSSYLPKPNYGAINPKPDYSTTEDSIRTFSTGTVSYNRNSTRMEDIKAHCHDGIMKVRMRFNGTFDGLIYSSGYSHDSSCSYVNGTGRSQYEFDIRLDRCGTVGQRKPADGIQDDRKLRSQYMINMVTVQYNSLIEKSTDEHFRVACEYPMEYWKTLSFPMLNIVSGFHDFYSSNRPEVRGRTGNPHFFTVSPPQCIMEILEGNDVSGTRVRGPIQVGDALTLVIRMKSDARFDIRVSNCYAHNGSDKRLLLVNSEGCVTGDKLMSEFSGSSLDTETTHVSLYSHFNAFRFTGSPALYLECSVHMCLNSCPDKHCNWRKMYKRSAELTSEVNTTADTDSSMSESVNLFQALEVRHDEEDIKQSLANRHASAVQENVTCMKTSALATLLIALLLALVAMALVCFFNCLRIRREKSAVAQYRDQYSDFNGRIPLR